MMSDKLDEKDANASDKSEKVPSRGEDDASTEIAGDDSHLHQDQKAPALHSAE